MKKHNEREGKVQEYQGRTHDLELHQCANDV